MTDAPARKHQAAVVLAIAAIASAVVALAGTFLTRTPTGPTQSFRARRVVVFTLPGVTWTDVAEADTPHLDAIVKDAATAALAPRSASVRPAPVRGYLTLGAGNRAMAPSESTVALEAYHAEERIAEGVTAEEMLRAGVGRHRRGEIVHLGIPELAARQTELYHGTEVGALGETLARAGIPRGVVSAADQAVDAKQPPDRWGAPVLGLVDRHGTVTNGTIRGLVEAAPGEPFGVRTDARAFVRAFERTYARSRVVLAEPGETVRADAFARFAEPGQATVHRVRALARADRLLGLIAAKIRAGDLLLVVAPSSASNSAQEHLTTFSAWTPGSSGGLAVSATTHRPGVATLTDVAPTILSAVGIERTAPMSGRPMRIVAADAPDRPAMHAELDEQSVFRERFVPIVFYSFVALFVVLSALVGLVFLARLPLAGPLVAMCYVVLAVPLATFVLTAVPLWRLGVGGAQLVLWGATALIAAAAWLVPGARWTGAIPVLVALAVFIATDLATGGHLVVNAVFGNSVLAAGRFYGIPNTGSALFFGASVLALAGVGELTGSRRWGIVLTLGLLVVLVLTGLPPFGADVGGFLTGILAVAAIVLASRGGRIPWRVALLVCLGTVIATLAVAYVDALRPPEEQTHLGRFAEQLFGNGNVAMQVVLRKATQSFASLGFSRFTYVIPLGVAALAVLLRRPRGPLRDILPRYPLLRAGLVGLLVAGVLGFALNDSGVAVPALLLAQAVPVVVLLGVDDLSSRTNSGGNDSSPP